MFIRLGAGMRMADDAHSAALTGGFCVTGSVAVGTAQDRQDITATRFDPRALSVVTCGLYRAIREFEARPDPFFKSITALVYHTRLDIGSARSQAARLSLVRSRSRYAWRFLDPGYVRWNLSLEERRAYRSSRPRAKPRMVSRVVERHGADDPLDFGKYPRRSQSRGVPVVSRATLTRVSDQRPTGEIPRVGYQGVAERTG